MRYILSFWLLFGLLYAQQSPLEVTPCDALGKRITRMWEHRIAEDFSAMSYESLLRLVEEMKDADCWVGVGIHTLMKDLGQPDISIYQDKDPQSGRGNLYYDIPSGFDREPLQTSLFFYFDRDTVQIVQIFIHKIPPAPPVYTSLDTSMLRLYPTVFSDSLILENRGSISDIVRITLAAPESPIRHAGWWDYVFSPQQDRDELQVWVLRRDQLYKVPAGTYICHITYRRPDGSWTNEIQKVKKI